MVGLGFEMGEGGGGWRDEIGGLEGERRVEWRYLYFYGEDVGLFLSVWMWNVECGMWNVLSGVWFKE
jgi:hypothetical protein